MRLRNHLIAIVLSLIALTVPALTGLTQTDSEFTLVWSVVSYVGILTSPGLSFSLFLRKWVKNISDDMSFSITLLFSILWVLFLYTWQSNQGLPISHIEILWSAVGISLVFTLLGNLPNGKKITASEPIKNKLPMFIAIALSLPLGIYVIDHVGNETNSIERLEVAQYNMISVARQTEDAITVRINNPSESTARLTINFSKADIDAAPFVFTDVVSSGITEVTFATAGASNLECNRYLISYYLINAEIEYGSEIAVGNLYCKEEPILKPALPTNRNDLLDYIYSEGLK